MGVDLSKIPQWLLGFAALVIAFAAAYGMFFAECRTQLFGLAFGKDRVCSSMDLELVKRIEGIESRIDGMQLTVTSTSESVEQGCPFDQSADKENLVVMYGSRDGTSCRVTNKNYYKELALYIPPKTTE